MNHSGETDEAVEMAALAENRPYRVIFVAPTFGVKPVTVLGHLSPKVIDWHNSLMMLDVTPTNSPLEPLIRNWGIPTAVAVTPGLAADLTPDKLARFDFLISCGWGWKISPAVLGHTRIRDLNCHSSLLPEYKGPSVYVHYWANCDHSAGVTVHELGPEFDSGRIIEQRTVQIRPQDSVENILENLSVATGPALVAALDACAGGLLGSEQVGGSYYPAISTRRALVHRLVNRFLTKLRIAPWRTSHTVED